MGSEPVIAPRAASTKGTTVLQDEQSKGLALINALDVTAAEARRSSRSPRRAQQRGRGVQGQPRARLRRHPRGGADATQKEQLLDLVAEYVGNMRDGHAQGEDGRGAAASGRHPLRLDRRDGARQRLLLPHPQPRDPDRVRPSAAGHLPTARERASRRASTSTAWSGRRTGTTTARTCCGSTTSATAILTATEGLIWLRRMAGRAVHATFPRDDDARSPGTFPTCFMHWLYLCASQLRPMQITTRSPYPPPQTTANKASALMLISTGRRSRYLGSRPAGSSPTSSMLPFQTLCMEQASSRAGHLGASENIPNPYFWFWYVPLDRVSAATVACTHYYGSVVLWASACRPESRLTH